MSVLSVIATPIGNLEDISARALRLLKEADFILCEDTRQTRRLLDYYGIKTATLSYHQHSNPAKEKRILNLLRAGKNLALVTDAGTPGVSDPGSRLVSLVREQLAGQTEIVSIPGPSALAAALAVVGVGFDRFLFLGFLPHKKGRQSQLQEITRSHYPVVLYESKHRIAKLLTELSNLNKQEKLNLRVYLARELTKMHESFYFGPPDELLEIINSDPNNLKGEFVVLIQKI